jgi:NADH dehydrogenase
MRILVLGGSGFVGRQVVRALERRGHAVIVGTRRPAARHPCPAREAHFEDLVEPKSWERLLSGVDAVVNAVGILRERRRETYERVHHLAAAALARACARRGARLLHVSALGLHAGARSGFIASKLAGERAVAASGADYCIVRPSLLDGEGGFGARWLRRVAGWPVHLVPADAAGRIAAFDVRDLGEAIAALCDQPGAPPREAELGGMRAFTMAEYLHALRAAKDLKPALRVSVPGWLARAASHVCDLLHFSPFSFGHWQLMQRDNVPCPNLLPRLLGRAPLPIGRIRLNDKNPEPAPRLGVRRRRRRPAGPRHRPEAA